MLDYNFLEFFIFPMVPGGRKSVEAISRNLVFEILPGTLDCSEGRNDTFLPAIATSFWLENTHVAIEDQAGNCRWIFFLLSGDIKIELLSSDYTDDPGE